MPVHTLEDSTSGLCHTPGTRAGFTTLVGSNPTSSANTNRCSLPRTPVGFVFCGFRAHFRLLELENTKTAGQDFRAEMPSLGFRVLEFEEADTSRQVRTNLTPQRSPTTHIL